MIHFIFDIVAALSSFAITLAVYFWRFAGKRPVALEEHGPAYVTALVAGAVAGGYLFGTLNLALSGMPGIGRSIVGALAGAIAGVEIFKKLRGIGGSTGLIFVPAFASSVAVGRLGCFFSGLDDMTYGVETASFPGVDFGDGVPRHPVQLYESVAMLAFLLFALVMLARQQPLFMRNGFYVMVLYYATQRFFWEFLKPYGTIIGPFNVFHFVCAGLVIYAVWMMRRGVA